MRILEFSDIHFLHPRTPTRHIVDNFLHYLHQYDNVPVDLVIIAGDVFDRDVSFNDRDITDVIGWFFEVALWCAKKNATLRVLEGTPSHDAAQARHFGEMIGNARIPVDYRYIDTVMVEKIPHLDLSILYVNDEYHPDTEVTLRDAKAAIKDANLTQVDIAVMHGCFNYQLPPAASKAPRHNESEYLSLVKHYIFIGHHHTHSVYDRIIASGSFDRLSHGQEEPKGFIDATIKTGEDSFYFIENEKAMQYLTLTPRSKTMEGVSKEIKRAISTLQMGSFLRLRLPTDHPASVGFNSLKRDYEFYYLSKIGMDEDNEDPVRVIEDMDIIQYIPVTITENNIIPLILEEAIRRNPQIDPDKMRDHLGFYIGVKHA